MKDLDRREFLKNTIFSGIGMSAMTPGITAEEDHKPGNTGESTDDGSHARKKKKVIVAGAGIAGLCCAYELMKKGHEVIVLEAAPRHGGHVMTGRDGLSDGLYADLGAEHITKPGYERYWEYTREFNLTVLPYPRRVNMLRQINGEFYREEQLHDPAVLRKLGFNEKEIGFLQKEPLWNLRSLYLEPYLGKFTDEYQPFGVGYDDLDFVPVTDIYKKEGASPTGLGFVKGTDTSALYELWRTAIMKMRKIPLLTPNVFRIKGGNQELPNAFAQRLGDRVWLNCPVQSIRQTDSGVTVSVRRYGKEMEITADFFANCIPLPAFKKIPVTPQFPAEKQYVIDNVAYNSYARFVFQASSRFWLDDGLPSINLDFEHPDLWHTWQLAEEVKSHRVVFVANGSGGVSAQRALAVFRDIYPGKHDTIEQVLVQDWTKATFSPTCERLRFPMGELSKFWPEIMRPYGRIHFAGAYADNLFRGQEAATRSANRVAEEIDKA